MYQIIECMAPTGQTMEIIVIKPESIGIHYVSPYFESKILVINFEELLSHSFDRGGFLLILHTDQKKTLEMCASLCLNPWCSFLIISLLIETREILRQEFCRCIAGRCCPLFRSHDISFVVLSEKVFGVGSRCYDTPCVVTSEDEKI